MFELLFSKVSQTLLHFSQFMAAHIHGPADNKTNADVQYTVSEFTKQGGSDEAQGEWTGLTDDQIQYLKDGLYYINIHSNDFPDGELRGQIWLTQSVRCLLQRCISI